MDSCRKLNTVVCIMLLGLLFAITFHAVMSLLGYGYPLNTFLFYPQDRFMDFYNIYYLDGNLDPYFNEKHSLIAYFPFSYLVVYPFTWLKEVPAFITYTAIVCTFLVGFMYYYARKIASNGIKPAWLIPSLLAFFLSYPVLFCLDRSNLDNLIFVIVALFVVLFLNKKYWVATLLLAMVIAMKGYPVVFIILFLKDRRWLNGMTCLLLAVLLNVVALLLFKSHTMIDNLHQLAEGMQKFNIDCIVGDNAFDFSSSLFQLLKLILWYLPPFEDNIHTLRAYHWIIKDMLFYYFIFCACAFSLISLYVLLLEKVKWKQVMLLVVPMIVLPYASEDYKLIFLLIPLFMFFAEKKKDKHDLLYSIFFALLLIPKNYFLFKGANYQLGQYTSIFSVSSVINITMMILFTLVLIRDGCLERRHQR